ncbi:MAG: N-6 DNA methylase [Helicobacteraceae bacterium]|jgi:adenine-specific DNA-methyltransferase|nr:N-6 DNA methylase [Helicobacteraceae bacterium]
MDNKIERLKRLTNLFTDNLQQYKSAAYDESNARTDFIDKFFEALDWDVRNEQGFSESYRDVIREDKITINGSQKAPDYCFRIGGVRKFFVEAKKPSINIKECIESAYQLRRYAYTAKLPLSILTDFEEFAVYDTRIKPDKNDKASVARIFYCTFREYEENFNFIYNTFSKNAILKGSFDKYIEENKNKRGTSEVDSELLNVIEGWRVDLAKNIALRNGDLSIYNLNTIVQKIIDRVIFLRIAEDKGIEDANTLKNAAAKQNVYESLNRIFISADAKYNSGLFKTEKWIEEIKIDDKVLSNIVVNLYYPDCPYEFSVLPIEILGNIYEKFLGKTIYFRNVKGGHTAIVEDKPEARKAGGVYYTPQYIVDYITQNTIGVLIKDKTPTEIASLRFVDPACGSGSFLTGAYRYLLDFHIDYYTREKNIKAAIKKEKIFEEKRGQYKLTIAEKQRILLNNIYGVDIDMQAVEVTKLSLYLKLLENEGKEAKGLFKFSDLTLLPNLENNIKCGNSLIGADFYAQGDLGLTDEEQFKVNCFDWEKEFPAIFKAGGFDAVIGNPPYVFTRELMTEQEKEYYNKNYKNTQFKLNTYILFVEKSFTILSKHACFGFIIPNNWLTLEYNSDFRKFILENVYNIHITNCADKVFADANVDVALLIFSNFGNSEIMFYEMKSQMVTNIGCETIENILRKHNFILNFSDSLMEKILKKIENKSFLLQTVAEVKNGVQAYTVGEGSPQQTESMKEKRVYHSLTKQNDAWIKYVDGVDVKRYVLGWSGQYIKYGNNLSRPRKFDLFNNQRLLVRQIPSKPPYSIFAAFTDETIINDNNSMIIRLLLPNAYSLHFILGIINSKLITLWFIHKFGKLQRNIFPQFKVKELRCFIIPALDLTNKHDKAAHDNLVLLVDKMLSLKRREYSEPNPQAKMVLCRQIEALDNQIDRAVYSLYALTPDEIKIVENK